MSRYSPNVREEYAPGFMEALAGAFESYQGVKRQKEADAMARQEQELSEALRARRQTAPLTPADPTPVLASQWMQQRGMMVANNLRVRAPEPAALAAAFEEPLGSGAAPVSSSVAPPPVTSSLRGSPSFADQSADRQQGASATLQQGLPPLASSATFRRTPGSFDPATRSFGVPPAVPPMAQPAVDRDRFVALPSGGFLDMTQTPDARATTARTRESDRLRGLERSDANERGEKLAQALLGLGATPAEADAVRRSPALADNVYSRLNAIAKPTAPVRGTPEYNAALDEEEKIRARHRPPRRDPNAPPPERSDVVVARKQRLATQLADDAVAAFDGDPRRAMASMTRSPAKQKQAEAAGLTIEHYDAAAQRYKDRLTSKSKGESEGKTARQIADDMDAGGDGESGKTPAASPRSNSAAPAAPKPTTEKQPITSDEAAELRKLGYTDAQITARYTVK